MQTLSHFYSGKAVQMRPRLIAELLQLLEICVFAGASFSESFYGLQRVSLDGKHDRLSSKAKYWSLFCLVGLPYLVHKIEKYVAELQNLKVR